MGDILSLCSSMNKSNFFINYTCYYLPLFYEIFMKAMDHGGFIMDKNKNLSCLTVNDIRPVVAFANYMKVKHGAFWGERQIDDFELILVVEGCFVYESRAESPLILSAGDVLLIPPLEVHTLKRLDDAAHAVGRHMLAVAAPQAAGNDHGQHHQDQHVFELFHNRSPLYRKHTSVQRRKRQAQVFPWLMKTGIGQDSPANWERQPRRGGAAARATPSAGVADLERCWLGLGRGSIGGRNAAAPS